MKKILMGTTALVAATAVTSGAVEAGETSLDISGYNYTSYGAMSLDGASSGTGGNDLYTNSEVHFNASTTLDSGLNIAFQVQYEAGAGNTSVDENFLTLSDSWGSVIAGAENLPNYKMHVSGAKYTGWHGINTNTLSSFVGFSGSYGVTSEFHSAFMSTYGLFNSSDNAQVSYYSPRISGLQIGIGYAPDNNVGNGPTNTNADIYSAGINYSGDLGGAGVNASAGYIMNADDRGDDDEDLWNFGLDVSTGGFTVGVSYATTDSQSVFDSNSNVYESETYTAGVQYSTGPYTVGLAYVHGEAEGTTANTSEDEGDRVMASIAYSLGGGATWDAHLLWSDMTGEVAGNGDDVEAVGVITGIAVNF